MDWTAIIVEILKLLGVIVGVTVPLWWSNRKYRKEKDAKSEARRAKRKEEEKIALEEDRLEREARQHENDEHWRRNYRSKIEKVHDRIHEFPKWRMTRERYQGIEEDYKAYKELNGNHYVDTLMEELREHYKNQD